MSSRETDKNIPFFCTGVLISVVGTWFATESLLFVGAESGGVPALIFGLFGWILTGSVGGVVATFYLSEDRRISRFQNVTALAFVPFVAYCTHSSAPSMM